MSAIATIIIRTAGGAIGTMIVNRGPAGPSGASDFADLGGVPADNDALAEALALKALTTDLPTDYEITSAQGRRLIASLKVAVPPSTGRAYFASTKSGSITFTVLTSTGYAKLINSVATYGSTTPTAGLGAPGTPISFTVVATGSHRAFGVSATDSAGVHSGNLTYIDVNTLQLTAIDVASATALTELVVANNQLTELNVSANTALTSLICQDNQLTALDLDANNALVYVKAYNNLLTTAVVDQILVDLDELNVNGDRVDLGGTGNGAASATGIAAAAGLVTDGWTAVSYNV